MREITLTVVIPDEVWELEGFHFLKAIPYNEKGETALHFGDFPFYELRDLKGTHSEGKVFWTCTKILCGLGGEGAGLAGYGRYKRGDE